MTIQQFHREFKVFFDKTDSSAYPEFLDGEIDIYLNEAQERMVKHRYGKNNIFRSGFEEIQKRTDDLKNLVITRFTSLTQATAYQEIGDNVYRADLGSLFTDAALTVSATEDYQFYLKSIAKSCKADGCCAWSRGKVSSVEGFQVTFIKRPVQLNIGTYGSPVAECELSDHLHKELLQEAIQVALENIGSPRIQTQGPVNVQRTE